jgi:hypothetical protein
MLALRSAAWVALICLAPAAPVFSQERSEKEALGFVASVAQTVYAAAYPTATYKDWKLKSVRPAESGLDVVVRLLGVGLLGDDLYVDLVFKFRDGVLADMGLAGHNAMLMPPFGTTAVLAGMASDLMKESGRPTPAPAPPPPVTSQPSARRVRVASTCGYPLSVWVRIIDRSGTTRAYGSWDLKANARAILSDSRDVVLEAASPDIAYYGKIPGTSMTWSGDIAVPSGDSTVRMRPQRLAVADDGVYELGLSCDNVAAKDFKKTVSPPALMLGATMKASRERAGAEVVALLRGMPAEAAGIQVGDIILESVAPR